MKSIQEFREEMSQRRGAIAVLSVVFLVMILAFASFSVDFGYMVLVDQEMQSAVDGAALAAAQELQLAPDGGQNQVVSAAVDLAAANTVNGQNLTLQPRNDVDIGNWDEASGQFTPFSGTDLSLANAVRVRGELSNARNNAVNLFFAPVLGHKTHQVADEAIAVIGRTRMRDVMLVIDCSGSMSSYNRMTMTRAAAFVLIDELGTDDRLGLAVYSYPVLVNNGGVSGNNTGRGNGGGITSTSGTNASSGNLIASLPTIGDSISAQFRNNGGRNNGGRNNGGGNNGGGNNGGGNNGGGNNGGGNNGGGGGETRLSGRLERQLLNNFQPVRARIPQLIPNLYASTTCIGGGMRVAIEEFIANPRYDQLGDKVEQVMVLMTDGQANETEPPGANPIDSIYYYADLADRHGIIIHGITLGQNAQSTAIEDAADTTDGQYHHVSDGDFDGLFEIYRGIGRGGDQPRLVR
jgi:Mg-chelatase subunit ChlD